MSLLKEVKNGNNFLTIIKYTHHPTNKKPHECGVCIEVYLTYHIFLDTSYKLTGLLTPLKSASPIWFI